VRTARHRGKLGRKARLTVEQIDHARELIAKSEFSQYVSGLLNVECLSLYGR